MAVMMKMNFDYLRIYISYTIVTYCYITTAYTIYKYVHVSTDSGYTCVLIKL